MAMSTRFSPSTIIHTALFGVVLILCSSTRASTDLGLHDANQPSHASNPRSSEDAAGSNATGTSHVPVFKLEDDAPAGPTVLYNASVLANTSFSESCVGALSAQLNCSGVVAQEDYLYTWGGLADSDIETICTDSCSTSFDALRASVATACLDDVYTDPVINDTGFIYGTGFSNDLYNVESVSVHPLAFIDYYLLSYKLLCMKDDKTSAFCYLESANGTNSTSDPCGNCGLGAMRLQLEDPRTFDESLAQEYSSSASSCQVTAAPLTTSASLFLPDNNTLIANLTTTSTCTGSYVALPTGQSCDDFATSHLLSTDGLLSSNGLVGGCADWPGNLTELCVQNNCQPYIVQQNDTCLGVAAANNITLTQLVSWNPSVDPLCRNWEAQISHVICVTNPMGYIRPTETISDAAGGPTPASTAAVVPTDAMAGSNTNCGAWYTVSSGETCALVTSKNAISLNDFYFLNPEINANCTNLWAESAYCIEPVGDITTYPGYSGNSIIVATPTITLTWASLTPVSAPTYSAAAATGYPLANGSLAGCFQVFENSYGALACDVVADLFGVSVSDWVLWNPSVLAAGGGNYSSDTCFLANETEYCGSFYDQSLVPTTAAVSAFLPAPTDATPNATSQCLDWYLTQDGDTCDSICQMADIPYSSLYAWNPALGDDCKNLWVSADYCVAGPGWSTVYYGMGASTPAPSTSASATATATSTVSGSALPAPAPTQPGTAANCEEWYIAVSGDTCQSIADRYGITLDQFYAWNPYVATDCTNNLWAQEAYCVLAPSTATTTTATASSSTTTAPVAVTPPAPTQSGIPSNCNKYAVVSSGGCYDFATTNGITLDQLYLWNPVLNNDCENFWANEAYCVGVSS